MAPKNWSIKKVVSFFNVSDYMIRAAHKLAKEKGILELPAAKKGKAKKGKAKKGKAKKGKAKKGKKKKGKTLSEEVTQSVLAFYEDDEYTRLKPGKRDCVSLGKKEYHQKRLLLCNLKERLAAYKEKKPAHKIGLSKFCSLRPKWCVTVSSSGTHWVCVCTIHQNTKLLVDAFSANINGCMRRINMAAARDADGEQNEEVKKLPTVT